MIVAPPDPPDAKRLAPPGLRTANMARVDFVVRIAERDEVERLEPLWRALRDHHAGLPAMPPVRSAEDSWEHRKGQYLDWLSRDAHTLLVAERGGGIIGYAVVSVDEGPATWDVGERAAELETLSVLASERGRGVGRALTEAAAEVARNAGAPALAVGVAHTNADAIRFYEREGFEPFYLLLLRA
jgi:ribosomal protein S18 acetylase RimI-like enzyme